MIRSGLPSLLPSLKYTAQKIITTRNKKKKSVPSREESLVIICVSRPEEIADVSTLRRMLGTPAGRHIKSLRTPPCFIIPLNYITRAHDSQYHQKLPNTEAALHFHLHAEAVAVVAEWYRHQIMAGFATSSSPVPLKTRRVGQRCTLNLSRAETYSRWCGVVVRRGGASSGVVHVT
ncbi:uncharacterized protein TNCV_284231 [Trichonephila clavipes]|uniref:Uncharacterized protein n=1 Tax=Trichonephila clavipes TaxID=2585209 RepID=A0A8X6VMR7_TRICX|nr:uncharacterized protein TNCV_284231 [Trichonephila clavipes]